MIHDAEAIYCWDALSGGRLLVRNWKDKGIDMLTERPHMSKMSIPALLLNRGILADAHMAIAARTMEKNKASPELAYL